MKLEKCLSYKDRELIEVYDIDDIFSPKRVHGYNEYEENVIHKYPDELLWYIGVDDPKGTSIYDGDWIGIFDTTYDEKDEEYLVLVSKHQVIWGGSDYPAWDLRPHLSEEMNSLSFLVCSCENDFWFRKWKVIRHKYE